MRSAHRLVPLVMLVCSASCASVAPTRSGFLPGYQSLQPLPGWGSPGRTLADFPAGSEWWRYKTVVVEPIQVRLGPSSPDSLTSAQIDALIEAYELALREVLPDALERVEYPAPNSVVVRAAITEVETTSPWFQALTTLLLLPLDTGGATVEIELRDGGTRRPLALLVNADQAYPHNLVASFDPIGHARQALEEAARWIGQTLSAAVAGRPISGPSDGHSES